MLRGEHAGVLDLIPQKRRAAADSAGENQSARPAGGGCFALAVHHFHVQPRPENVQRRVLNRLKSHSRKLAASVAVQNWHAKRLLEYFHLRIEKHLTAIP